MKAGDRPIEPVLFSSNVDRSDIRLPFPPSTEVIFVSWACTSVSFRLSSGLVDHRTTG